MTATAYNDAMLIQVVVLLIVLLLIGFELWKDVMTVQKWKKLAQERKELLIWQIVAQYAAIFFFFVFLVFTATLPLAIWVRRLLLGIVMGTAVYVAYNLYTHQIYLYRRRPPRQYMVRQAKMPQRHILQGQQAIVAGRWFLVGLFVVMAFLIYWEYQLLTG
ncbi:MAG: hypothetical protein AAF614_40360 [Chloroflexota bacterium]